MSQGIYLFDKNQELIMSISPDKMIENYQNQELNGIISGYAKTEYDSKIEDAIYYGVKDAENFLMYKIRNVVKDNGLISLSGIHILFDDLKGCVVRDIRPNNVKANLALERILYKTGWKVGTTDISTISSGSFYHVSALSAFYDSLKIWDYEFIPRIRFSDGKIVEKRIDIYDTISKNYGKWYEYGDKLVEVVAESSTDELYTAFIGRGKGLALEDENGEKTGGYGRKIKFDDIEFRKGDYVKPVGQDYIEIIDATKLYGYPDSSPRIGIVDFDNIEDKQELAEATYQFALENCRPKLQLKATALENEVVELGETVAIIRPDMNIRYKVRVFKIKKDFLQDKIVSYEFGDKIVSSAGERLKADLSDKRKRQEKLDSYIDSLRAEINSSYFNDSAYNYDLKIGNKYNLPAGYYSFDRPIDENPTKVIYMGAGKMLIADTKNPDGSWKWTTMATGAGVAAETIVGTLGEFAKVNAKQINVNSEFDNSPLGKKVVIQGKSYNNVKITPEKGIQVLDNRNKERVQIGNWDANRYGLKLTDETGKRTVLDDIGILQSWQDSQTDNVDSEYPLNLRIFIPAETKKIYKASLQIYTEDFRAYQRGNEWKGSSSSTSDDGGGDYVSDTTDYDGEYRESITSSAIDVTFDGHGVHNHGLKGGHLSDTSGNYMGYFMASGDHKHRVNIDIPAHSHRVNFIIPAHRHSFDIPGHTHEPIFGIITKSSDNSYRIRVNDKDITKKVLGKSTFYGAVENIDISEYLKIGKWNTVSISNSGLGRVSASIFMQAFLNYGG